MTRYRIVQDEDGYYIQKKGLLSVLFHLGWRFDVSESSPDCFFVKRYKTEKEAEEQILRWVSQTCSTPKVVKEF